MNRYDFVLIFDAKDANPNGDPDAGNLPRIDPETGHGLVTDVCLKRKVRNYVGLTREGQAGHRIYFSDGAVLNNLHKEAYDAAGLKASDRLPDDMAQAKRIVGFMCGNFWDIRAFGAVMSFEVNAGQVRGPIQLSFARSVDPIVTLEHAITRASVTNQKDKKKKDREMGRKFTVPYGLYVAHGFVNPFLAKQTGFSDEDLELLWESLVNAFQFDQSAARPAGSMAMREIIVFKHPSELGSAPSHKLFEAVSIQRKPGTDIARAFSDYSVTIDAAAIPSDIEVRRMP